jgi:putative oxidoreductase
MENMSFEKMYSALQAFGERLKSPLLLVIRLFWGGSFLVTGLGKFGHLEKVADFFQSLGIPFPLFSATLTAFIETVCGTCLLIGFASRLVAIPLILTMITAILTSEQGALKHILSDPQRFIHITPFSFLFASLLVFVFGPGSASIDYWLWKDNA